MVLIDLYNSLKSVYNGFNNLKLIIYNIYNLNNITLEQLENEQYLKTLKTNILNSGCMGIKFCQWYISHTNSNYDTRSIKLCDAFNDIYDQCDYHSLEHTKTLFETDFSSISKLKLISIDFTL